MKRAPAFLSLLVAGLVMWPLLTMLGATDPVATAEVTSTTLNMVGASPQSEITPVLDAFTDRTGISVSYEKYDLAADLLGCTGLNNCPDVALIPNLGLVAELANYGDIVPVDAIVPDFDSHYTAAWKKIGRVGNRLYGVPFSASSKSMIWYRPQAFSGIGATTPTTWPGLITVADAFLANAQTPFSIGAASGPASGWPLTDIVENILLRVGGPDLHSKLVHHQVAWTDPEVVEAMQRFSDVVGHDDYLVGGISGALQTNFTDAFTAVFGASPQAAMYFGASFAASWLDASLTPEVDYDFFTYPEIDSAWGEPIVGGGDVAILFRSTTEAQSLIQFLASPDAGTVWINNGTGHISPNTGVSLSSYSNPVIRAAAEQVIGASDFAFDLDDQLPSELQQYFWGALMNYVAHQDQLLPVLQGIEGKATELQGTSCTVDPLISGSLTYTDTQHNPTIVELPVGAVTTTTSLAYSPIISLTPPDRFSFAGHAFLLEAYQSGAVVPGFTFELPITVTVHYSDADVAGMGEDQLLLLTWHDGAWADAACGPYDRHPTDNLLAVPICHLSRLALFGQPHRIYLPLVTRAVPPAGQELANAYAGKYSGTKVTMLGPFTGGDILKFENSIQNFEHATGIDIQYEGSKQFEADLPARVAAGVPPDLADFPNPALLGTFARQDKVLDLGKIINAAWLKQNYNQSWLDMATMPGATGPITAGVWARAIGKSLVWYPKQAFDGASYTVPTTWEELLALQDQIAADGDTPWCIGIESGAATGWPMTDWIEDVMLRTTSLKNYDNWVAGTLKFNSPEVRKAISYVTDIWFNDSYVYGGRQFIATTFFGDAPAPMFEDPPKCWLHRQGPFITSFFPEGKVAGVDYDVFYLPPIDPQYGKPVLIAGDIYAAFVDRPEVRAVIQYFSTGDSIRGWVEAGGVVSPHKDASLSWYPDPVSRKEAEIIQNATSVRVDASDLMPGAVGAGSFWQEMTSYVRGTIGLDAALTNIDASWP